MEEIAYKNLAIWHLADLEALSSISAWEDGPLLPCLDGLGSHQDVVPS